MSIRGTTTIRRAMDILNQTGLDTVPVTNKAGQLLGVVSCADIAGLFAIQGRIRNGKNDCDMANLTNAGIYATIGRRHAGVRVQQVMNPEVVSVRPDASIAKVIESFVKRRIRRLFVTDQDAVLVGDIDVFELLRTVGEYVDPTRITRQRPK